VTDRFEVAPYAVPTWPGITPAGAVVARFLAEVRVTGDAEAAARIMAPLVAAHQVVSEAPATVYRSPAQYAEHVRDMLRTFGRFRFVVTDVVEGGERVYVRWEQHGHDVHRDHGSTGSGRPLVDVGSAVYRVAEGRVAEYWIQLDRLGLERQLRAD
jgi:predicted ester cyclase